MPGARHGRYRYVSLEAEENDEEYHTEDVDQDPGDHGALRAPGPGWMVPASLGAKRVDVLVRHLLFFLGLLGLLDWLDDEGGQRQGGAHQRGACQNEGGTGGQTGKGGSM